MKLVLSIRSLNTGGAERQFIELVKYIDKKKFDVYVITMYGGEFEDIVKNIDGVKYFNLQKKGRYDLEFFFKYKKLLNEIKPDVIYSFLGEMNLFSAWCKPKYSKLIWGFRASNMDFKKYGKVSEFLFNLQKYFIKKVDKIITNSYASTKFHKSCGFDMTKAVVIHNGIDINRFKRDDVKRYEFRKKYNLKDKDLAIGIVARIDAMKGYPIFSKAIKNILEKYPNIKVFAIGDGDLNIKRKSEEILGEFNNKQFLWLGKIKEVENIYNGLDLYVSSSIFGEGFSNSIAEAMACEVPCVVTDVGDSKIIVGELGEAVKPNSVEDLQKGIENMLSKDLKILGRKCRERIINNFSIEKMVKKTESEIIKCVE